METILSAIIMMIIFPSFYLYCKRGKISLMAPESMSYFWDAICFLRNSDVYVIFARVALLLGIPVLYLYIYCIKGTGAEFFPFIICAWVVCFVFRCFQRRIYTRELKGSKFFGLLLLNNPSGIFGAILWGVRVLYLIAFYSYFRTVM